LPGISPPHRETTREFISAQRGLDLSPDDTLNVYLLANKGQDLIFREMMPSPWEWPQILVSGYYSFFYYSKPSAPNLLENKKSIERLFIVYFGIPF